MRGHAIDCHLKMPSFQSACRRMSLHFSFCLFPENEEMGHSPRVTVKERNNVMSGRIVPTRKYYPLDLWAICHVWGPLGGHRPLCLFVCKNASNNCRKEFEILHVASKFSMKNLEPVTFFIERWISVSDSPERENSPFKGKMEKLLNVLPNCLQCNT